MSSYVTLNNLSVIFGKPRQQEKAIKLLDEGMASKDIQKETGTTVAVRNVSLDIQENELFVIVGLSGSGKSSLIRTINLLNKPTRGEIIIGERDLMTLGTTELRNYRRTDVSMVFQHFGLINHRTVLDNVAYPLEIQGVDKETRTKSALEVIEKVGLKDWEYHLPHQLSGGMKQRVGLARALTNNPKLLLMDEPYSALDPLIRREMQTELLNLEDDIDRTIVFITHDMNEAFKMGDRIALMKDGEIVQLGTPKEFLENPADEYVRSFIADVDKTRILKVRNIMRKPSCVVREQDDVKKTLQLVLDKDSDYAFVVDKENHYLGFVTKTDLEESKAVTLKGLIQEDTHVCYRNEYLQDTWSRLNESDYDIAVLDTKRRLRGVFDSDEVAKVLAK